MSRRTLAALVVLAGMTLAVYGPVPGNGFVTLDDDRYVYDNALVKEGFTARGMAWAFTYANNVGNWHPLTWFSHMLDVEMFGLSPGGHHAVSLLLHLANVFLFYGFLARLTGAFWRPALAAAVFAVHPLHVESVAWISERKDVLSAFFWLLSLLAYAAFLRRRTRSRYLALTASLALALMAKPMAVTLPMVLLLLDWWPLGRIGLSGAPGEPWRRALPRLLLEKVPLFLLSAASGILTVLAQSRVGAVASTVLLSLPVRIGNALFAYADYLWKTAWPSRLSIYYPITAKGRPLLAVALSVIFLAVVTAGVIRLARRQPSQAVGWFWYLGTLVPVIGLVQVGYQAMADRYTYIPHLGIMMAVLWGADALLSGRRLPRAAAAWLAPVVLVALGAATYVQAGFWRDSMTIYRHSLEATPDNWIIHNNLGVALGKERRVEEAILHYRAALISYPDLGYTEYNLGNALLWQGKVAEAVLHLRRSVQLWPDGALAREKLGEALMRQKNFNEAARELLEAVRLKPDDAKLRYNLGYSLRESGREAESVPQFKAALRLDPSNAQVKVDLAIAEYVLSRRQRR